MNAEQEELLGRVRIITFFQSLPGEALVQLCETASLLEYAADQIVFLEGEQASGLYLIHQGWLKIIRTSLDGREHVLRLMGPGETFNEIGVFANRPNPATAMTLEPTQVL